MSTEKILAGALRLPRADRARVAEGLLASLEEPTEEVATAWVAELEKRAKAVTAGEVNVEPWDVVRKGILTELAERRAERGSS